MPYGRSRGVVPPTTPTHQVMLHDEPTEDDFVVNVAAQICDNKVNLEIPFPGHPDLDEFTSAASKIFGMEAAVQRPEGTPAQSFKIERMQVYDTGCGEWQELVAMRQLTHLCQVYAFQKETPWHKESAKQIPPAQKAMKAALPDTAAPQERVRVVFEEIDVNSDNVIDESEFLRGFKTLGVTFSTATVMQMFRWGDLNNDGVLEYAEFHDLCVEHPTLTDCLYYRTRDYWEDYKQKQEMQSNDELLLVRREQEHACRDANEAIKQEVKRCDHEIAAMNSKMHQQSAKRGNTVAEYEKVKKKHNDIQQQIRDSETEVHMRAEKYSKVRQMLYNATQDSSDVEERFVGHKHELDTCKRKEEQLRQALEDARRDVERHQKVVDSSSQELRKARSKVKKVQNTLEQTAAEVDNAKQQLRAVGDKQAEARTMLANLERMTAEEEEVTVSLAACKEELEETRRQTIAKEKNTLQEAEECSKEVLRQEEYVHQLKNEYQIYVQKRKEVEVAEQPLLDQEVQLKEQRHSISQRETQLRASATGFFKSSGRTGNRLNASMRATTPNTTFLDSQRPSQRLFG